MNWFPIERPTLECRERVADVSDFRSSSRQLFLWGGYREAVTVVEEFIITVAINLVRMPQVADQVNMALSCWCPDVLMRGSVSEMQETIGYFLEALERIGVIVEEKRTAMSESCL